MCNNPLKAKQVLSTNEVTNFKNKELGENVCNLKHLFLKHLIKLYY